MTLGLASLPILVMASIFTGFIITWQVEYLAGDLLGLKYLGMAVLKGVLSQIGPLITGLVLAGRIGAKVAAEVGTMRVTEQIDAMECLSLNPMSFIIAPKIYAGFIMVPIVFVYASFIAIISSQILATAVFGLDAGVFYNSMHLKFEMVDVYIGLVKSCVFGGITALCGCYFGFYTKGGAVGVGVSTRRSVVASSLLILIANLVVSQLMS